MTADREQVRRDAEECLSGETVWIGGAEVFARHCLALLAELEQAERRVSELDAKLAESRRMYAIRREQAASVPALVEALRLARRDIGVVQRAGWDSTRLQFAIEAIGRIDDALTVYEQSQGKP